MSPMYHVEVENQEKETKKHRRSVPFNTHVSAAVTAMALSWRRARAPCMHLLEIPPRLQAGILRHMLTARLELQAETTHALVLLTTCSDKLPGTAKKVMAGCTREHRPSSNSHYFQSFIHSQVSTTLSHQHVEVTDTWKTETRPGIWHLNLLKLHMSSCGKKWADGVQTCISTGSRDVGARHFKVISAQAQGFEEFSSPHSSSVPKSLASTLHCNCLGVLLGWWAQTGLKKGISTASTTHDSGRELHRSPIPSKGQTGHRDAPSKCWKS